MSRGGGGIRRWRGIEETDRIGGCSQEDHSGDRSKMLMGNWSGMDGWRGKDCRAVGLGWRSYRSGREGRRAGGRRGRWARSGSCRRGGGWGNWAGNRRA